MQGSGCGTFAAASAASDVYRALCGKSSACSCMAGVSAGDLYRGNYRISGGRRYGRYQGASGGLDGRREVRNVSAKAGGTDSGTGIVYGTVCLRSISGLYGTG